MNARMQEAEPLPVLPDIDPSNTAQRDQANAFMEDVYALNKEQAHWLERFQCALQLSHWGLS